MDLARALELGDMTWPLKGREPGQPRRLQAQARLVAGMERGGRLVRGDGLLEAVLYIKVVPTGAGRLLDIVAAGFFGHQPQAGPVHRAEDPRQNKEADQKDLRGVPHRRIYPRQSGVTMSQLEHRFKWLLARPQGL